MQLALALSLSMLPPRDETEERRASRSSRTGQAGSSSATVQSTARSSSQPPVSATPAAEAAAAGAAPAQSIAGPSSEPLATTGGATAEEIRCNICFDDDLPGELEGLAQQEGGWGATTCGHIFHYECLGEWLKQPNPTVETTRGPRNLALVCPQCRADLSKSSSRVVGKRKARQGK